MKTIWKYELPIRDMVILKMPIGSSVLYVAEQGELLCLWAMIDSEQPLAERSFAISGTGRPLPGGATKYINTVVIAPFVWHVFEVA